MSTAARQLGFAVLRWSGVPVLVRELLQRDRVTVVIYHDVRPETLDMHLSKLSKRYNFLPLREYVDARLSGRLDGLPPKSLVVTLDDGLRIHRELLDVLRKYSVTPTMFLCAGMVGTQRMYWWLAAGSEDEIRRLKTLSHEERLGALSKFGYDESASYPERCTLSLAEVDEMRPFVDFQAHTVSHPILTQVPAERALSEIRDCRQALEQDLGLDVYAFAYPNGSYSEREIEYVMQAGYRCALTTEIGFNGADSDLYRLKRLCLSDDASANEVIVQASGVGAYLKRLLLGPARSAPAESSLVSVRAVS